MPLPSETCLFRARRVLPLSSAPIDGGGIAVRGSEILAVGCWEDLVREHPAAGRRDLGDVILLPGLINAHCHLDYTMMRNALSGGGSFTAWIKRLNAIRRSLDTRDYLDAISSGLAELRRWGCTTVLNIESFPEVLPLRPESTIRVWWFLEVMDIRSRLGSEEALAGALGFLGHSGEGRGGFGLSPHAPYTVSPELFELCSAYSARNRLPLCSHLAESEEEVEMFSKGSGEMHDFLASLGRSMRDCGGTTPVSAILGKGLLPPGSLLVHMNCLTQSDKELLRSSAGVYPVIHCPRTHAFFQRKPFDLEFFRGAGIPVLIGTDSLASNRDLDMFSEMREMASAFPGLAAREILEMASLRPAAAIGRAGLLGELSPGACADFMAIPDPGNGDPHEQVLANTTPPAVWVSGHQ